MVRRLTRALLERWKAGGDPAAASSSSVRLIAQLADTREPVGVLAGTHEEGGLSDQAGYEDRHPDTPGSHIYAVWGARPPDLRDRRCLVERFADAAAADTILVAAWPDKTDPDEAGPPNPVLPTEPIHGDAARGRPAR